MNDDRRTVELVWAYLLLAPVLFGAVGVLAFVDGIPDPFVLVTVGVIVVGMLSALVAAAGIVAHERSGRGMTRALPFLGLPAIGAIAAFLVRDAMRSSNPGGDAIYVGMALLWITCAVFVWQRTV